VSELAVAARRSGLVASISGSTIWRWLDEDAIRPWFPQDPDFARKAGLILDLYERVWNGQPLAPDEFVISADEKTSIQARRRCHPTQPPGPGTAMRVEHEYDRAGAWAYLAEFGRAPGSTLWAVRAHHRHRGIRPTGRTGHDHVSVSRGPAGLLDRR
jgi:hypothetical protein